MSTTRDNVELREYVQSIPKPPFLAKGDYFVIGCERIRAENSGLLHLYSTDVGQVFAMKILQDIFDHPRFIARNRKDNDLRGCYAAIAAVYRQNKRMYHLIGDLEGGKKNSDRVQRLRERRGRMSQVICQLKPCRDFWIPVLKRVQELYHTEINQYVSEAREDGEKRITLARASFIDYETALSRFVKPNLLLVVDTAKHYTGHGLSALELIAEGNLGLLDAAKTYDPELLVDGKQVGFLTHALWQIKKTIRSALRNKARNVRLPSRYFELFSAVARAEQELCIANCREPTLEEIAQMVGTSVANVKATLDVRRHDVSLRIDSNDGRENVDGMASSLVEDVREQDYAGRRREFAKELLKYALPREAEILKMRAGFEQKPMALEECGKVVKLTRERVRQIELEGLEGISKKIRAGLLDEKDKDDWFWIGDDVAASPLPMSVLKDFFKPKTLNCNFGNDDLVENINSFDIAKFCAEQNL